jgi:hypothetical protein
MRIGVPEVTVDGGEVTWSVAVSGLADAPDRLWFTLPADYADMVTERADPALIGLLVPAMRAGEPVTIDGPVTDELVFNLARGCQYVLDRVIAGLSQVPIEATRTVPAGSPAGGVATGFSAGVDSFAVLAEHLFAEVPPDLRLTHLTFFNVGSHGPGEGGRQVFRQRFKLLTPAVTEIGLPFIPVDSNLDDFYHFTTHLQTHSPRSLAAASLLQAGFGRYYLASSTAYDNVGVFRSDTCAFADAVMLPLLTTGQLRFISHGDQYTRVQKTVLAASIPLSHTSLNVCVNPPASGGNCSRCFKCLRTELTLEIAGLLEEYGSVFDLDVYRQKKKVYVYDAAWDKGVYPDEIRAFARERGFRLPPVPRMLRGLGRVALAAIRRVRLEWRTLRRAQARRPGRS